MLNDVCNGFKFHSNSVARRERVNTLPLCVVDVYMNGIRFIKMMMDTKCDRLFIIKSNISETCLYIIVECFERSMSFFNILKRTFFDIRVGIEYLT